MALDAAVAIHRHASKALFHTAQLVIFMASNGTLGLLIVLLTSPTVGAAQSNTAKHSRLAGGADPAIIELQSNEANHGYVVAATGRGVSLAYSPDLKHWSRTGRVFETAVPTWASEEVPGATNIWAPDLSFHDGLYYLYYSVSTFGKQRSVIGLAVNESLDPKSENYRWVDRGKVVESWPEKSDFNAIDPALFVDESGKWWLFFGSFWTGIKVVAVDPLTGKPFDNASLKPVAAAPQKGIEAPYVIFRNGFYYLFLSWGNCCDGAESKYRVAVGRARSATGPYLDASGQELLRGGGTLILESDERYRGPGHNSILTTEAGQWIAHHTYDVQNLPARRMLQIRPLTWTAQGWPLVGQPLEIDLRSSTDVGK